MLAYVYEDWPTQVHGQSHRVGGAAPGKEREDLGKHVQTSGLPCWEARLTDPESRRGRAGRKKGKAEFHP